MIAMLLVTLHGDKPGVHPLRNNVHAYDKEGKLLTPHVLEEDPDVILSELRSICLFGNFLYLANANRTQNSLLCYQGTDTSYRFVSKFVSHETCTGILHPFDFAFDGAGHCYVSSQDTNVITRLKVSADGKVGTPAPTAAALPSHGVFLPGTFVASSVANLCGLPTTAVPSPLGLGYSADANKKHSVRGVLWANDALYVVDQPAGRVKVYDRDGRLLGQSNQVETPVHLVAHNGSIYVTGANEVLTAKLSNPAGDFILSAIPGLRIKNACGMTFTKEGNAYTASRTENIILKFDANFEPMKFRCELPDNPEFLLHT
jgi:hypothetical protein